MSVKMDTYQPIYDAVRSRISGFDGQRLMDAIVSNFDISQCVQSITEEARSAFYEQQRPSILLKPKIGIDGNQWYVLYGDDLQNGVAGFGDSPALAMKDFDQNWSTKIKTKSGLSVSDSPVGGS